jgi:hypothetical protein
MGKIFLVLILLAFIGLAVYAGLKTVPFLQTSFSSLSQVFHPSATPVPTPVISPDTAAINSYLISVLGIVSHPGGKVICAHRILEPSKPQSGYIYLWAVCQEYYSDNEIVKTGSGISVPISLTVNKTNNLLQITSHRSPRAGSSYAADLTSIFPPEILQKYIDSPDPKMLEDIQNEINLNKSKI